MFSTLYPEINMLAKEQTKQNRKAHIKCPLEKFHHHCRSGILHIPKEHLRNGWKIPKDIVWTPFLGCAQNQGLACGLTP